MGGHTRSRPCPTCPDPLGSGRGHAEIRSETPSLLKMLKGPGPGQGCPKEGIMNELTFLLYDRPARASVERDRELVVLRIGRKRLTFPVRAVPALVKMLA